MLVACLISVGLCLVHVCFGWAMFGPDLGRVRTIFVTCLVCIRSCSVHVWSRFVLDKVSVCICLPWIGSMVLPCLVHVSDMISLA